MHGPQAVHISLTGVGTKTAEVDSGIIAPAIIGMVRDR